MPLKVNHWENVPAHKFVQILNDHAKAKLGTRLQQTSILVLLFRCYLCAFGTARNLGLAGKFLNDAAILGNCKAQALTRAFYEAAVIDFPHNIDIKEMLISSVFKTQDRATTADKSLH